MRTDVLTGRIVGVLGLWAAVLLERFLGLRVRPHGAGHRREGNTMKHALIFLLLTASVAAQSNGIQCDDLNYTGVTVCETTLDGQHTYTETQLSEGHSGIREITKQEYTDLLNGETRRIQAHIQARVAIATSRHEGYCKATGNGPGGKWKEWRAVHCQDGKLKPEGKP